MKIYRIGKHWFPEKITFFSRFDGGVISITPEEVAWNFLYAPRIEEYEVYEKDVAYSTATIMDPLEEVPCRFSTFRLKNPASLKFLRYALEKDGYRWKTKVQDESLVCCG